MQISLVRHTLIERRGTYTVNANHVSTARGRANVDEEHLAFLDSLNLVLVVTASTNHTLEDGRFDVNLNKHLWHAARVANDASHHVV